MRSRPNCFEVVLFYFVVVAVVVKVVFVVVVILNVDVVVQATSKVDLRLLVIEVEFHSGWVGGGGSGGVCKAIYVSIPTLLSLVEVELGL